MPAVEIDEVELLRLRKQDQTVHALMANPKAKKKIFEAYKEHDPNVRIPELEIEAAARAPVQALEDTVSKLQKEIADDKAEREKNAKLDALKGGVEAGKSKLRKEGWTDEGIAAVEKVMEERGIIDVEIAAAFYEKQNPPQSPATPRGGVGSWDFTEPSADAGEADYAKALMASRQAADGDQLVMREAGKALHSFRGANRR